MKVAIFVDKYGSAIWRLAEAVRINCPYIDIKIVPVHPKRNTPDDLFQAQDALEWCDIIDIHYWKSGEILRSSFPTYFDKAKVLFHFNPYDLHKMEWDYDTVVVGNNFMQAELPLSHLVPYGVDLSFFKFNEKYTDEKIVHMSVARIEGKKGVLEVAKACRELGYKFLLIGRVSKADYMHEIVNVGGDIEFIENADEEILRKSYYRSAVHVCNSVDNFESGTLPVLEAMACGVPVLTRNVGHAQDLFDGGNMVIRSGEVSDIQDLKTNLKMLMENREYRLKIREKAWDTIKNRDIRRMAIQVSDIYYKIWLNRPLVSVIVPTHDRPEILVDCLVKIANQDYRKIEVVVADSGKTSLEPIINRMRERVDIPIKYIKFSSNKYSLAEARNRAVLESQGEILVFCDERIGMESNAISKFAENYKPKLWQWGVKDDYEKPFVENFSCINREDFINAGMFNERIDHYGGMSQEVRTRVEKQGYVLELNKEARAYSLTRNISKSKKREDIIESKLTLFKMYR